MSNEFRKRKNLRIKQYDYSSTGAYFINTCIKDRKRILSDIVKSSVGVRRTVCKANRDDPLYYEQMGVRIRLTGIGMIEEKHLLSSGNISGVKIDKYVIMPDHIHMIISLDSDKYMRHEDGSSMAPTPTPANQMLPHIISTFKRFCNKEVCENIFQRGYIEHIMRDLEDYETRLKYMHDNPLRWYYNELHKSSKIKETL